METTPADCRMWLRSIQGGAFKTLFEALKEVIHDVNVIFDAQGFKLVCVNGARCALIYLKIRAENLEEYHCPTPIRVGLNMAAMFKLLKSCGSHDTVVLYNRKDAENELGIRICNSDKNSRTDFQLKLLDVDYTDITTPDVEFDSVISIPSVHFQRIARDMMQLMLNNPLMTIESHDGMLTLSCNGDFANQTTVIGETGDGMTVSVRSGERIRATYSLKYITQFTKASSLCAVTELYIKKDYPLVLRYNVAGLGELKFVLGPKTDDDE